MVCGFPQPGTQLLPGALFSTRAFLCLGSGVLDSSGFRAGKGPTITRAVSVPLLRRLQRTLMRVGCVSCLLLAATLTEGAFESEKVYFPGYILMIWKMGEQ